MSDPDAAEPPPPPQPPRPVRAPTGPISTEDQLAADEQYARRLAEQYNGAAAYGEVPRSGPGQRRAPRGGVARRGSAPRPEDFDPDRDRSFFDGVYA